ncbi:MAG: MerR family transcriptional regulator [Candidatus Aminicenantes bacterium]|nr:MerR family transcriptional regulator [Candidatus Aminicenantes bacterium]
MRDEILTRDEFISKAKISEKWLKEMEQIKIIEPSGFTENNIPFYTSRSIDQSNHIKKFIDMGYSMEAIGKITKKFGFPRSGENGKKLPTKKQLTIGGLADRVRVSTRTIKHWEEMGIIEANMRSEGGFRLYSEIYVYLCNLIKDLQLFGYSLDQIKKISDLFRTFLAIESNIDQFSQKECGQKLKRMVQEIKLLLNKIDLLKKGTNRWEELLNKKSKEINSLFKKNEKRLKSIRGDKNG